MILLSVYVSTCTWTFLMVTWTSVKKIQLLNSAVKQEMTVSSSCLHREEGQSGGYWHWTLPKEEQLHVPPLSHTCETLSHHCWEPYISKLSKTCGESILGVDIKTPAPRHPFPGQTLLLVGEHHLPHICLLFGSPAKHGSLLSHWHLPCTNHSSHLPAVQFLPSFVGFPFLQYSTPHSAQACTCTRHLALNWCGWPGIVMLGRGGDEQKVVICGCRATAIFNHLPFAQLQCCHISSAYLKINIHKAMNERVWI